MGREVNKMAIHWDSGESINHPEKSGSEKEKILMLPMCRGGGLPRWLSGTESACSAGDMGSIPGLGRSPGGGNGSPVLYTSQCWVTPGYKDGLRGGLALADLTIWWWGGLRIPWAEEPGGLQSIVWQRVRHDWAHTQPHGDLRQEVKVSPLPLFLEERGVVILGVITSLELERRKG